MARIAYLDHSFHRTTKSTQFLAELLVRHGHDVTYFWDEAWQGGAPVPWSTVAAYDVVIMFQSYCTPEAKYFRLEHPNVIYIPMLDQFGIWQGPVFNLSTFWEPFQGSKVINFSSALHATTTAFGIASHFVRYYRPVPERQMVAADGLHGFFWLRRERELPWSLIRKLIANYRFDSFHVHLATDPGFAPPTPPSLEDVERHRITTSTWFEHKSDFEAVMARANVYFAPRLEEGIGQSFLEAMARGQCVVAPDHGTMNEYIVHGVNGLLYDHRAPVPLDMLAANRMGEQARIGASFGRAMWEHSEAALIRFILTPSESIYGGRYQHPTLTLARTERERQGSEAPCHAMQDSGVWGHLRAASKRYAALRATRFLWGPLKGLVSKLLAVGRYR